MEIATIERPASSLPTLMCVARPESFVERSATDWGLAELDPLC